MNDNPKIKLNFIDKAISFFAPRMGAKRLAARWSSEMLLDGARKYAAAGNGKRVRSWNAPSSSANSAVSAAGSRLRDRSRDLVRNNAYASKAVKGIAANVVGSGIRPSIQYKNKLILTAAKKLWEDWGEEKACDFDGVSNIYGMQFILMRAVAESGEVLVRKIRSRKKTVPIQLQILEADHLDNSKDGIALNDGGYIQLGIEFNKSGQKVAYWLFPDHPGEHKVWKSLESVRVPASEILHLFLKERPGQIRGVPFGVGSFIKMKDFDDYEDAQLIRQKIAACFSVFIQSPEDPRPGTANPNGGSPLERVEPGIIEYLKPGQEVSFANPPATEGYDMYAKKMLQGIAAGYDITYELLTSDLSNVNFSSGRMGWIEMGRMVTQWQNQIIIEQFCKGVWEWFSEAAYIAGKLPMGLKCSWTSPRREMIDPLKETKGLSEKVRAGFGSWQSVIRELGGDPEEVYNQMAEDKKKFDKEGFKLTSDARHDPNRSEDKKDSKKEKA